MNDAHRRKINKIEREEAFFNDNAADFADNVKIAEYNTAINIEKTAILALDAQQTSGFDDRRQAQEVYERRRRELDELLRQFVLAAAILDDDVEGTAAKFRMPRPRNDQNLIAKAASFAADAAPLKNQLIAAGLAAEALNELSSVKEAFQTAALARNSAKGKHSEATGGMIAAFRRIMDYSKKRDNIVKLKYRNNPEKMAAWAVASRLERPPRRTAPATAASTR